MLKEIQKIAKKIKKENPELKHREAVSQAWKELKALKESSGNKTPEPTRKNSIEEIAEENEDTVKLNLID